jgi:hypothetical protein
VGGNYREGDKKIGSPSLTPSTLKGTVALKGGKIKK